MRMVQCQDAEQTNLRDADATTWSRHTIGMTIAMLCHCHAPMAQLWTAAQAKDLGGYAVFSIGWLIQRSSVVSLDNVIQVTKCEAPKSKNDTGSRE